MKPLVLIILDGWGIRVDTNANGIELAQKPNFDRLWKSYPHTAIEASGPAVGLPKGIMGNSEVGHMNIGAGRVVYTGLSQIYKSIEDGSFNSNPALLQAIEAVKKNNSTLHLMGLVSDGAVHSHLDHLYALLKLAKSHQLKRVSIHCFMDGRDTSPQDGIKYIKQLEEQIQKIGVGRIASVLGRYYVMDRDKRWDRIEKAYDVLMGQGAVANDAESVLETSYQEGVADEFVVPKVLVDSQGRTVAPILDHDAVIFFNFRADRAREITRALTDPNFSEFSRKKFPKLSAFVCMAPYDETFNLPVAFKPNLPKQTLAEIVSQNGLKQFHIAETEKYAHVTFFFNGGVEKPFPGEDRFLVPSPREVATYDLKPEMSAIKITEEVMKRIESDVYDVVILNFANPDMLGHTAKQQPIIQSVGIVDACLGKITDLVLQKGGEVVITADHGNAEQMVDEKGGPHTAHTLNPVPFIVVSSHGGGMSLRQSGGRLCDVAPTLLELLKIPKPVEMTGKSLIVS